MRLKNSLEMKTSHILEKRWQRGLQTKIQSRRMWHVNMLVQKDDVKQYILQRE
jgi:Uri superfamily endonuclease